LASPQGQTGGGSSLPRLEGKKFALEVVRYKFYRRVYDLFGWLKLPYYHREFFEGANLKKSIIKPLEGPRFFVGTKKSSEGLSSCKGSGQGSEIDLIHNAYNSPKPTKGESEIEDLQELIREYLALKGKEEKTVEDYERLREIEEKHKKFPRVYKRLRELPKCSTEGHLGRILKSEEEIGGTSPKLRCELTYHPHRCHSLVCPICSFYESKEKYHKVFELLKLFINLEGSKLAFITLTAKSFENPIEAVEFMFKARQKIYNLNLSERFLKRLKPYLIKELFGFYRHLKEKEGREYAVKRIKLEIKHIREFLEEVSEKVLEKKSKAKKVRLGDIYSFIWKFEIHKTKKGWHGHWHIIGSVYVPKVLLNAFWRYTTKGRGEITDIRKVEGKEAVDEISKYETKPLNRKLGNISSLWDRGFVIQSNGVKVSIEELFELELALHGRQKITVWGEWGTVSKEEKEKSSEGKGETVYLWCVDVYTKRPVFHIPRAIRRARKFGREVFVSECEIVFAPILESEPNAQREFKGEIYACRDGELVVRLKVDNEGEREWFEELLDRATEYCLERSRKKEPEINPSVYEETEGLPDHLREKVEIESLEF